MKIVMKEPLQEYPTIIRTDSFDNDLLFYLTSDKTKALREKFRSRNFTVKESDVAYRVINHWEEKGLLPDVAKEGGWRKFNVIEIIWLKAISRLRDLGVPLNKIKKAKEGVLINTFHQYGELEYYVAKASVSGLDPYIFMFPNGNAFVASSREIELHKSHYRPIDSVLISIKSILLELGLPVSDPEILNSLEDKELKLVKTLRSMDKGEIRAEVSGKTLEKISSIETLASYPENPSMAEIAKELNNSSFFGEMVTKFEGGKAQSVKIKRGRRFG